MLPAGTFAVLWAMKAKRSGWLAAALLAVLSIKEDVALVLLPMALVVGLDDRRSWRWPVAVAAVSALWFVLAIKVALPLARPEGATWDMFAARYGAWGKSPGEALVGIAGQPLEVGRLLVGEPVARLLRSLAYIPILDPLTLLASAPAVLEHRLAQYDPQRELHLYYGLGAITVWLLAMIRSGRWVERRLGPLTALLLVGAPLLLRPAPRALSPLTRAALDDARLLRATIPAGAAVRAQTDLVPHLPISPAVKLFPGPAEDFVALRPGGLRWPAEDAEYRAEVLGLLRGGAFGVVARSEGIVILRRGAPTAGNAEIEPLLPPPSAAPSN